MKPKISIIIPIYNTEKYLVQCLDSVVNQTYKYIEIICVNDGSTDNSMCILESYALKDSRIKLVNKKNGGLSSARNEGHKYVTGEYIMYIDGDDWIDLDTCERAVKNIGDEGEKADIIFWNYIREFGGYSKPKFIFGKEKLIFATKEKVRELHRRFIGLYEEELQYPEHADSIVTAWGKLYKSSIIIENQIEFVDTKIIGTEDALFNLYVFGHVDKAVYLPNCFNHYRKLNKASITKKYKKNFKCQWDTLHEHMYEYILDNKCDKSFEQALNNRISLSIIGLGMNVLRGDTSVKKNREIKAIISSDTYRKAIKQLKLGYFSLQWKIFFWFAKINCSMGVYLILACIKKLKGS